MGKRQLSIGKKSHPSNLVDRTLVTNEEKTILNKKANYSFIFYHYTLAERTQPIGQQEHYILSEFFFLMVVTTFRLLERFCTF